MRRAIYPGTFDPITNGHLDVVERAAVMFDEVIVGVAPNAGKSPVFTLTERVELASEAAAGLPNVTVRAIEGLTVDFAEANGCVAIVRGLRAVSDFEYEFQLAQMNRHLNAHIDTVFLMPSHEQFYTSSNIVRAVAIHDCERISKFAPPNVVDALRERLEGR
ncbi:MAG: pantetheine-phosphate adenylyltransferase [Opitutales bacterium]